MSSLGHLKRPCSKADYSDYNQWLIERNGSLGYVPGDHRHQVWSTSDVGSLHTSRSPRHRRALSNAELGNYLGKDDPDKEELPFEGHGDCIPTVVDELRHSACGKAGRDYVPAAGEPAVDEGSIPVMVEKINDDIVGAPEAVERYGYFSEVAHEVAPYATKDIRSSSLKASSEDNCVSVTVDEDTRCLSSAMGDMHNKSTACACVSCYPATLLEIEETVEQPRCNVCCEPLAKCAALTKGKHAGEEDIPIMVEKYYDHEIAGTSEVVWEDDCIPETVSNIACCPQMATKDIGCKSMMSVHNSYYPATFSGIETPTGHQGTEFLYPLTLQEVEAVAVHSNADLGCSQAVQRTEVPAAQNSGFQLCYSQLSLPSVLKDSCNFIGVDRSQSECTFSNPKQCSDDHGYQDVAGVAKAQSMLRKETAPVTCATGVLRTAIAATSGQRTTLILDCNEYCFRAEAASRKRPRKQLGVNIPATASPHQSLPAAGRAKRKKSSKRN